MDNSTHTALVTGATSGLGFEAAAQVAEQGYGHVIVTGRTAAKANDAREALATRTKRSVFGALELDLDDKASVDAAVGMLVKRGGQIDLLILNAGIAPPGKVTMSADGIERTVSSSLVGHHILTMRLLEHELLAPQARIVIAGSEAARGDVPTFHPVDFTKMADDYFGGDIDAAVEAQMRMKPPAKYKSGDVYATAKVLVAWWAAQVSRTLPEGMSVNAVSPGATPETNAIRNAPFYMRHVMMPMMKLIPGMSHSVSKGARRYLDVAAMDDQVSGKFFASPPKKMTGSIVEVSLPHIEGLAGQEAGWRTMIKVSGVDMPASAQTVERSAEPLAA